MGARRTPRQSADSPACSPPTIDFGVLNEVVGFRVRRLQNELSRGFTGRIDRKQVRPGLFSALALISTNPGISQITLARELAFNVTTVVLLLDSLEKLDWAERRRGVDRRRRALFVTKKGEEALADMHEHVLTNEAKIRTALGHAEMSQLFDLLDRAYAAYSAD
jgi:DNA-binding MarR family transcriptional regulator